MVVDPIVEKEPDAGGRDERDDHADEQAETRRVAAEQAAEHRDQARMQRRNAPGVYVDIRKLASVGIRVRRGGSYHGLAMNVSNDLEPFSRINPCGYEGLQVVKLADLAAVGSFDEVAQRLEPLVTQHLLQSRASAA